MIIPSYQLTATGFSGIVQIISINIITSTITVSANATSTNVGVILTPATPTFAKMHNLV